MKKILLTSLSIFTLLISGSLTAQITWSTNDGVIWDSNGFVATNPPPGTIISGDSLILNTGATWTAPLNIFVTQLDINSGGVVVINIGATLNADLINNSGTLLLYGSISTFVGINNSGTVSGTGSINSALGGIIPPIINSTGGSVNGCTDPTGCVDNSDSTSIGLPPPPVGGSNITYTGGVLAPTTCDDNVAFQADYTINVASGTVRDIGNISVSPGVTVTINSTVALSLCGDINNDGTIIVNVNGALAQLGASDGNQGGGSYEVSQTGKSDILKYNIWSSPVVDAVAIADSGSTEYEVFPNTNACDYFTYSESNQEWKYDLKPGVPYDCNGNWVTFSSSDLLGGVGSSMQEGRGYFVPGNSSATRTFKGPINNGNISVVKGNSGTWGLTGNPYPSGIDADAFLNDASNSGIEGTIWFWDNPTGTSYDSSMDYATWSILGGVPGVPVGGTSGSGSGTGTTPDGFIGVAQGFWVMSTGSLSANFKNAHRSVNNNQFFKKELSTTDKHLYWTSVETPSGASNVILVGYVNDATDGHDRLYDGEKLSGNASVKFASLGNGKEYAIQAIAPPVFGETKVVALSLFTDATGDHTFAEYKRENIPTGMDVYLKDNAANVLHDLTRGDYVVNLDGNQTYNTRFELVFVNSGVENDDEVTARGGDNSKGTDVATGVEDVTTSNYTLLNGSNVYTLYNSNGIAGDIQVISTTGTVVWTNKASNSTSVQIDLNGVSSGIYFIQVIDNNERVYANKIVNP